MWKEEKGKKNLKMFKDWRRITKSTNKGTSGEGKARRRGRLEE